MPTRHFGNPRRARLWNSRLWLLAAALGVASIIAVAAIVHDKGRLQAAARAAAQAMAEQVAALASGRLELVALETFAPVTPWATRGSPVKVEALVAGQRDAERCSCRDTLPVTEFFRFDVATEAIDIAYDGASLADADVPSLEALSQIGRAQARRPRIGRQSSVHLLAGPSLGQQVVVTITQYDQNGSSIAVYGLVGRARSLLASLFDHTPLSPTPGHVRIGFATLDTLSIEIATADGAPVFGVIGADHPFRGTVRPTGPFAGLAITVGLSSVQIPVAMLGSRRDFWHLGLLTLSTVLVIGFAVGSSRRELLLARARSDFIAGVSHDLRMPLAQILIASETLALNRERDEGDKIRLASSIVREARRLIGLVDNVMLFSRSGAVELRPRLEPVATDLLLHGVVEAVQLAVDDAKQTIEVLENPTLAVLTDRQLVRQALVNLVDNAIKYGAEGQCIRLSAEQRSPSAVRIYVDDSGPGIPAEQRARVFAPYERLSRDQTSERTGTGLGLAVVDQIVRVCDGRVWLEAGASGGTRAVIELRSAEVRQPAMAALERT